MNFLLFVSFSRDYNSLLLQDNTILNDDLSISIETSINELKNLNQYIDNELGQTTFC